MASYGYSQEYRSAGCGLFIPEDMSNPHISIEYADSARQNYDLASLNQALVIARKISGVGVSRRLLDAEIAASGPETIHAA